MYDPNIISKLRNDSYNKVVFRVDSNAFLVGGFIRDLIAIGKKVGDRDYVVTYAPDRAARLAQESLGGTLVSFKHGNMARLVLSSGVTMDFTRLRGKIFKDLESRDFTMNSIAYRAKEGIVDPSNGVEDVMRCVIRTTRRENIQSDPLRCLRAYRFKSELGWTIDSWTRRVITDEAYRLKRVARERITNDFVKMLRGISFERALRDCEEDGVLANIIICKNNLLSDNIKKMVKDMEYLSRLPANMMRDLFAISSQGMRNIDIVKLERLCHGCRREKSRLRFSNIIESRLRSAHDFLDKLEAVGKDKIERSAVFDILSSSSYMINDLVVLAGYEEMIQMARRFRAVTARRLVSAEDIIRRYRLKGEAIGRVLHEIDKERFLGHIRSRRQAGSAAERLVRGT